MDTKGHGWNVERGPGWEIHLGDWRELLPSLPKFDAIVTDPPYGIDYQHGGPGKGSLGPSNRDPIVGDDAQFDPTPLLELQADSKFPKGSPYRTPQRQLVMMGPNHYSRFIPDRGQWLVWDKSCGQGAAASFADAEFAWMNRRNPRCIYRHFWMGGLRSGADNQSRSLRVHPSQKPVELMAWLIETARIGVGKVVLDPYMGSGSTGVACLRSGRKFLGVEIVPKYFEIAAERLRNTESPHPCPSASICG